MKLLNDFFTIASCNATAYGFEAYIALSKDHLIYKGHFPGFPVTPGVVQLQIIHETVEYFLKQKIRLNKIPNSKFLQIIDPNKFSGFDLSIQLKSGENKSLKVTAKATDPNHVFFKVDAEYSMV